MAQKLNYFKISKQLFNLSKQLTLSISGDKLLRFWSLDRLEIDKNRGAMKLGWGICSMFQSFQLTYHARTTFIEIYAPACKQG